MIGEILKEGFKMKKILTFLTTFILLLIPIQTEATNMVVVAEDEWRTFMYDKDSAEFTSECGTIDFYLVEFNPRYLDKMQNKLKFNDKTKKEIHYIKYTVISFYGCYCPKYIKGDTIETNFECYDKNSKLIYKYDGYFDNLEGGTSPLFLYEALLRN